MVGSTANRTFGQAVSDFFQDNRREVALVVCFLFMIILILVLFRKKLKAQIKAAEEEHEKRVMVQENEQKRKFVKQNLGMKVNKDVRVNVVFVDKPQKDLPRKQHPLVPNESSDSFVNPYSIPESGKDTGKKSVFQPGLSQARNYDTMRSSVFLPQNTISALYANL